MGTRIAIVSTAGRYPDAASVEALWANVLDGRRAFRAIPPERLDVAAYNRFGREALGIVPVKAGLITDWRFDRARFRIPAGAFEATDLAHWLALDIADQALETLGGPGALDRGRTAVIVANTLTGEFSRAAALALRAPFMDEVLDEATGAAGLDSAAAGRVRRSFATALLERLPEPGEDTLAGGLANTIAGRLANVFDFKGGAFTVDAACASSLVAIAQAADALICERADVVLVGAVDLSLDPFELVGFSRVGALAAGEMRVFDARSSGFWPGEGAGFAVLMTEARARRAGFQVLATLRGWGLSTDGAGGLIRPTVAGQGLAISRACGMAGVEPADLDYVEAHGTGTPTGDPVEVRALAAARTDARRPLPIGSVKANIGHTKAAAGFAGLIKTIECVRRGVLAPHVSADIPHPVFAEVDDRVRVVSSPELLADHGAALAGVSSFGFGGVNAHVVIEGPARAAAVIRGVLPAAPRPQDAELFLFAAEDGPALVARLERLQRRAASLSWSDLPDAAAAVGAEAAGRGSGPGSPPFRAAVVAGDIDQLAERLDQARAAALAGEDLLAPRRGVCVARGAGGGPRIGLLFPGQAAPVRLDGGPWARRFTAPTRLPLAFGAPAGAIPLDTSIAQPAIVAASLAALDVLGRCGLEAQVALGHSLGELTALAWAGALDIGGLLALAADRGRACADYAAAGGGMIRIDADAHTARRLAERWGLVVACENARRETVVSGSRAAAPAFHRAARAAGCETVDLAVSHAFHSPDMLGAVGPWRRRLAREPVSPPRAAVVSSVTGARLPADADLMDILGRQLVDPVRFATALSTLEGEVDLCIEVGPGRGLARLATEAGFLAVSTDAFGPSLSPLCETLAAAFALGAAIDPLALTRDRRCRPIDLDRGPTLLANPCGRRTEARAPPQLSPETALPGAEPADSGPPPAGASLLGLVRGIVARELKLDVAAVGPDDRFDARLNLESLAVARIVARAARAAGATLPRAPTEFAAATSRILAAALEEMRDLAGPGRDIGARVEGAVPWIRAYAMQWRPAAPAAPGPVRPFRRVLPGGPLEAGNAAAIVIDATGATTPGDMAPLVDAVKQAIADPAARHLAILAGAAPLSAFARSLALEGRFESVRLISLGPEARVDIAREIATPASGYVETRIEAEGDRFSPLFAPRQIRRRTADPVGPADVALVTGGGRGVAAECALRLAEASGCALILCGRSPPDNEDVAAIVGRAAAAGTRAVYVQADVMDRAGFTAALERAGRAFGPPTVLVHAAGANRPMKVGDLTGDILAETLGPKVDGLDTVLAATGKGLQRVYVFGSIIGRIGLEGEAHYALANAWQTERLASFARDHPQCLALAVEWSVWAGAGMGENLGLIERLAAKGVDALSLDDALDGFETLVTQGAEGDAVVTSRFGPPPWLDLGSAPLEALRFVDRVLVHYPCVELVAETQLWAGRDPYLPDHRIQGAMTLPGVISLEAMAQVSRQLAPAAAAFDLVEDVAFHSAVTVSDGAALTIRICAVRREDGSVIACIRSAADGFMTDCARAVFRRGAGDPPRSPPPSTVSSGFAGQGLYGPLFFHGDRFRRVACLRHATSRSVAARIAPPSATQSPGAWFGPLDLADLVLGDPGARDAALHAVQAAVPYRQVAPASVQRIARHSPGAPIEVVARETAAETDDYTFDIVLYDETGAATETWRGVRFRGIGPLDIGSVLQSAPELASAYLERLGRERLDDDSLVVTFGPAAPGAHNRLHRGDGRPWPAGVSLSHGGGGLCVRSALTVGCDCEVAAAFADEVDRPPAIAQTADGDALEAGQAWVIGEALRKMGRRPPFQVIAYPKRRLPGSARLYASRDARILVDRIDAVGPSMLVAVAVAPARQPVPMHERQQSPETIDDA